MNNKNNNNNMDYKSIVHSIGHLSANQLEELETVILLIKALYKKMEEDEEDLLKIIFRHKNDY